MPEFQPAIARPRISLPLHKKALRGRHSHENVPARATGQARTRPILPEYPTARTEAKFPLLQFLQQFEFPTFVPYPELRNIRLHPDKHPALESVPFILRCWLGKRKRAHGLRILKVAMPASPLPTFSMSHKMAQLCDRALQYDQRVCILYRRQVRAT